MSKTSLGSGPMAMAVRRQITWPCWSSISNGRQKRSLQHTALPASPASSTYQLHLSIAFGAPGGAPKAIDRCNWYVLEAGEAGSAVCWSERFCLPLLMLDQQGHVIWRLTAIAIGPLPSDVFDIKDGGYVLNDANADIEPD